VRHIAVSRLASRRSLRKTAAAWYLLEGVEPRGALVEEGLRAGERVVGVGVLGDPKTVVRPGGVVLADVGGEPLEVAVPVQRDEVDGAVAGAVAEELGEPVEAGRRARARRRAELQPVLLLQRLDVRRPQPRGVVRRDVAAA